MNTRKTILDLEVIGREIVADDASVVSAKQYDKRWIEFVVRFLAYDEYARYLRSGTRTERLRTVRTPGILVEG